MLAWLKRTLRAWLLDGYVPEQPKVQEKPKTLSIWRSGSVVDVRIQGCVGLSLQVTDGRSTELVRENSACDRDEFWKAWTMWNTSRVTWEDTDEEFQPNEK